MNEVGLCTALKELVERVAERFRLPDKYGELVIPKVYVGFLPLKTNDDENFPYVLIRHESSSTDWEGTVVNVAIIAGAYCEGRDESGEEGVKMQGHHDCLNLLSAIRAELTEQPAETLAERYVLLSPIEISTPGEQPFPYWQADMATKWHLPSPAMEHIRGNY